MALLTRKLLEPKTYSVLMVTDAVQEAVAGIVKDKVTVMLVPKGRALML